MQRICLADDDVNIKNLITTFLQSEGYAVDAFDSGDALLKSFLETPCDLVILDVMMPGLSGFAVCTEIRKISTVPIIFLTARDTDLDYATGLNLGSDDYFTKPFSAMSLVMRVKAIFRRIDYEAQKHRADPAPEGASLGDVEIDEKNKAVRITGVDASVTPTEYGLLRYLIGHADRAVSREELLTSVWGFEVEIETRAVDDAVRRLRKKLADSDVTIEAVWGFGFRAKVRERHEA